MTSQTAVEKCPVTDIARGGVQGQREHSAFRAPFGTGGWLPGVEPAGSGSRHEGDQTIDHVRAPERFAMAEAARDDEVSATERPVDTLGLGDRDLDVVGVVDEEGSNRESVGVGADGKVGDGRSEPIQDGLLDAGRSRCAGLGGVDPDLEQRREAVRRAHHRQAVGVEALMPVRYAGERKGGGHASERVSHDAVERPDRIGDGAQGAPEVDRRRLAGARRAARGRRVSRGVRSHDLEASGGEGEGIRGDVGRARSPSVGDQDRRTVAPAVDRESVALERYGRSIRGSQGVLFAEVVWEERGGAETVEGAHRERVHLDEEV